MKILEMTKLRNYCSRVWKKFMEFKNHGFKKKSVHSKNVHEPEKTKNEEK